MSRIRRLPCRWFALLAAAVTLTGTVGLSAAAKLNLAAAGPLPDVESFSRCGGAVKAAVTGTTVTVSSIDTACVGQPVAVYVRAGTATLVASGTATATTTVLTLSSPAASVSGALVTADTWPLPTTWTLAELPELSCTPATGSGTCAATVTNITSWGWPTINTYLLDVTVSSTASTAVTWQVTINLSHSSLPFEASDLSDQQGGLVKVAAAACSAEPRTVTVKGTTNWGSYNQVKAGQTSSLEVIGTTSGTGGLVNC